MKVLDQLTCLTYKRWYLGSKPCDTRTLKHSAEVIDWGIRGYARRKEEGGQHTVARTPHDERGQGHWTVQSLAGSGGTVD